VRYHQITSEERYRISALRQEGYCPAAIAWRLGRHRSTISREIQRNGSPWDGRYRPSKAQEQANGRRSRSRRNQRFEGLDWELVDSLLREKWSPEQVSGSLRKTGDLSISHETIYRYVWEDRRQGGSLYRHLRCSTKKRRKRYGRYDSRGRLAGKRHISERPASVEWRQAVGHWEIDTMMGVGNHHCIVTLVERATGYLLIGKLASRTMGELARKTVGLVRKPPEKFRTITADNGTEFHSYKDVEKATGVKFYFATPHHAWERATNENTNGLIRQYLPKRTSMAQVSQHDCNAIAKNLNTRPRKRHDYQTPEERFHVAQRMLHFKCEAKRRLWQWNTSPQPNPWGGITYRVGEPVPKKQNTDTIRNRYHDGCFPRAMTRESTEWRKNVKPKIRTTILRDSVCSAKER
jgi:IS30 family transposase